jgi:transposase
MSASINETGPGPQLKSRAVGPLPLLNNFLERARIDEFLHQFVPTRDKRQKLGPATGLGLLLRNILISRRPLYDITTWANRFDPVLLGLPGELTAGCLNDDRYGRCLDALFIAPRGSLMNAIVMHVVKVFDLSLEEIHNDSTTCTFSGEYLLANGEPHFGQETLRITHGYNKDHRPDLKQLLFVLTTTADGSVPISVHVDHGNTPDDVTHIENWNTAREIAGTADFLYCADSKLCSDKNLTHIDRNGGRFVTVIPHTWSEHEKFYEWLRANDAPWTELLTKENARRKDGPPSVYRGYEHPERTVQGYRVLWIWSSQKEAEDRAARERRIQSAQKSLQALSLRIGEPRARLNTAADVTKAAEKILSECKAERWMKIEVLCTFKEEKKQVGPGRPNENTKYLIQRIEQITLRWSSNGQVILEDARVDGVFPLVTNDNKMTIKEVLEAYKRQPSLEKRFQQMKSVLDVRPVFLHSPARIEAFLFLYFLALLLEAIIEREARQRMKAKDIERLPVHPEGRPSATPTTARLFELFEDLRRHRLLDAGGQVRHRFYDDLTDRQREVLKLFDISPKQYMSASEV